MCLREHFMIGHFTIDTLLFADNQAIVSASEIRLQMGIHLLNRICEDSGLQISTLKTKVMAFRGNHPVSYTHLDVYKRQIITLSSRRRCDLLRNIYNHYLIISHKLISNVI